jgi:hypothetical protein
MNACDNSFLFYSILLLVSQQIGLAPREIIMNRVLSSKLLIIKTGVTFFGSNRNWDQFEDRKMRNKYFMVFETEKIT